MNAFVLHDTSDQAAILRWGTSAVSIVALHAALIALGMAWYTQRPPPGVTMPTIMVEMAPATAAPQPTLLELAPGPVMQEADASPPEVAMQESVQEQLAPTPPQQKPEVEAPPEQKPQPTPPTPEPARIVPDLPKPVQTKPKPVRAEAKKPTEVPPAPRTAAPPRTERQAPAASAISAGASASALASYRALVTAHLRRFQQHPPGGQQGLARVTFTLGRGGQVLASGLAGSSGHAALDAEALAMVRRAQPFPAFPPDIKDSSVRFALPRNFTLR